MEINILIKNLQFGGAAHRCLDDDLSVSEQLLAAVFLKLSQHVTRLFEYPPHVHCCIDYIIKNTI